MTQKKRDNIKLEFFVIVCVLQKQGKRMYLNLVMETCRWSKLGDGRPTLGGASLVKATHLTCNSSDDKQLCIGKQLWQCKRAIRRKGIGLTRWVNS